MFDLTNDKGTPIRFADENGLEVAMYFDGTTYTLYVNGHYRYGSPFRAVVDRDFDEYAS